MRFQADNTTAKAARASTPQAMTAIGLALLMGACATTTAQRLGLPPLQTVEHVDLSRYTGTWFEIAHYPQRFQKGCTATTATYTLKASGEIAVANKCRIGSPDGEEKLAEGRARVVDPTTNAKLEVSFFWPFWGDYWVVALGKDYEYAAVGHPSRDYLWILSRTPVMDETLYGSIVETLKDQGYEPARLQKTRQPPETTPSIQAGS